MKCVRSAVILFMLAFAGCGFAQKKPVGYDLGSCSPGGFYAVHAEYNDGVDITITAASFEPGKVVKLETPTVFKFSKEDADGKHYKAITGGRELVVGKADNEIFFAALVTDKGVAASMIFGVPGDGSKLAENAEEEFSVCRDLQQQQSPDPKTKTT